MESPQPKTRLQIGCLIALVLFSVYLGVVSYPAGVSRLGAAFAVLAFALIFLRVGWFAPFAIAGTYFGLISDAGVKGGSIESQMQDTVTSIALGTFVGLVIGGVIDALAHWNPQAHHVVGTENTDDKNQGGLDRDQSGPAS